EAVYEGTPRTSFHLGPQFVVTSSLTKVYGVSGLRCGWVLARPDLTWKMRRLNDLYSATAVYPGELLSTAAFQHLNLLRERARRDGREYGNVHRGSRSHRSGSNVIEAGSIDLDRLVLVACIRGSSTISTE